MTFVIIHKQFNITNNSDFVATKGISQSFNGTTHMLLEAIYNPFHSKFVFIHTLQTHKSGSEVQRNYDGKITFKRPLIFSSSNVSMNTLRTQSIRKH
jgi:hypothetical protein